MTYQKFKNYFDLFGYSPYFFVGGNKRNGSSIGFHFNNNIYYSRNNNIMLFYNEII